jgi:hypothetical protein
MHDQKKNVKVFTDKQIAQEILIDALNFSFNRRSS